MADQLADGSTLPLILSTQYLQAFIDAVETHIISSNRDNFISLLIIDDENRMGLLPAAELKKKVEK